MKRLVKLLVVVVLLLIVAVGVALYFIDHLAKTGIEKGGTYATGVDTTVSGVSIGLLSGKFGIDDLNIANPAGFNQGPHFLNMGSARLELPLSELTKDTVTVPIIELSDLDVVLEKKGDTSNYQTILDNLKKLESQGPSQPSTSGGKSKQFMVKEIVLRNIEVHPYLLQLGGGPAKQIPVPPIKEVRFSYDSAKGLDMAELTNLIMKVVLKSIVDNAGGMLGDIAGSLGDSLKQLASLDEVGKMGQAVLGEATKALEGVTEQAGEVVKGVTDTLKEGGDVGKTLDDAGKKIGEGLGGLFGGKKPAEEPKP